MTSFWDAIVSGAERAASDLTKLGTRFASQKFWYSACNMIVLIDYIASGGGRTVPRVGFADAQDDICIR
jgi:hypothetical protein